MKPILDMAQVEIALKKVAIRAVYGSREDRSGRFRRSPFPVMTSIEYDRGEGALIITFANGKTHRFLDVPEHVYLGLIHTDSKSVFFYDYIRDVFASIEQAKQVARIERSEIRGRFRDYPPGCRSAPSGLQGR